MNAALKVESSSRNKILQISFSDAYFNLHSERFQSVVYANAPTPPHRMNNNDLHKFHAPGLSISARNKHNAAACFHESVARICFKARAKHENDTTQAGK